jgi:hypothetical protein
MNPKLATFEAKTDTVVAGTTATPSQIRIRLVRNEIGGRKSKAAEKSVRVRVVNAGTTADSTNAVLSLSADATQVTEVTADKEYIIRELPSAVATGTLTLTGVVIDAQTVTIGPRVYQFRTGATALVSGRVNVDISARGTKAQGTLTIAEPVTAGDTIVIGDQTYVFVTGTADSPGEIGIGGSEAASKTNIVAAINGTDSINAANTKVSASAFSADVCTLTARYTGTQGNDIVTAELGQGLTHASNVFNAATLGDTTAGVNPSAAHAILDLLAAINGDGSAVVTAAAGAGTTVIVTSKTAGTAANSYATTETMANGSFGAATLTGGIDGANGSMTVIVTNAEAETIDLIVSDNVFLDGVPFEDRRIAITHAAP